MVGRRECRLLAAALALAAAAAEPAGARPSGPQDVDGAPIVIGRSHLIPSAVLGGQRRINVYLPPSYAAGARRYRVLYLLDGGVAEDFAHIAGLAGISAAYGVTDEFIVIGVEGVDRRHDLTPPSSVASDLRTAPTAGGEAAYRRFLVDEVKPWVAARYRIAGRDALIGESLAGLFVLDALLSEPNSFDDYVAVSPSLWWDAGSTSRRAGSALARPGRYAGRRLWLGVADGDLAGPEMRVATDRFVAAFRRSSAGGLRWSYRAMPGETHASVYHPAATLALRWAFAKERP